LVAEIAGVYPETAVITSRSLVNKQLRRATSRDDKQAACEFEVAKIGGSLIPPEDLTLERREGRQRLISPFVIVREFRYEASSITSSVNQPVVRIELRNAGYYQRHLPSLTRFDLQGTHNVDREILVDNCNLTTRFTVEYSDQIEPRERGAGIANHQRYEGGLASWRRWNLDCAVIDGRGRVKQLGFWKLKDDGSMPTGNYLRIGTIPAFDGVCVARPQPIADCLAKGILRVSVAVKAVLEV